MPILLHLAAFFCGTNALEKTGALRQFSAGRTPLKKPERCASTRLASSAAGGASAVLPPTLFSEAGAFALLRLANICGGTDALANIGARRQQQLPPSAAGSGRCCCPRPHSGCMADFKLFHGIALKSKEKGEAPCRALRLFCRLLLAGVICGLSWPGRPAARGRGEYPPAPPFPGG